MKQSLLVILLLILVAVYPAASWKPVRTFKFKNSCKQTIWVGGFGVPLMAQTGWEMPPGSE